LLTAKEVSKRQMLVLHVTQDLDSKLPVRHVKETTLIRNVLSLAKYQFVDVSLLE